MRPTSCAARKRGALDSENLGDSTLLSRGFRGRDSYTYTALPNQVKRYGARSFLRMDAENPSDELSAYLVNESQYNTFVYDALRCRRAWRAISRRSSAGRRRKRPAYVLPDGASSRFWSILRPMHPYTEMPKETRDDGEDFLRFFLESGAGYSVHYATARR